jgi:large subunit ribosomal protein L32
MTVRMRHTKGHTGNRRSHHALSGPRLSTCVSCGGKHVRHRACQTCGLYRGRTVINVRGRQERALARKQAKLRARGENAKEAVKSESKDSK